MNPQYAQQPPFGSFPPPTSASPNSGFQNIRLDTQKPLPGAPSPLNGPPQLPSGFNAPPPQSLNGPQQALNGHPKQSAGFPPTGQNSQHVGLAAAPPTNSGPPQTGFPPGGAHLQQGGAPNSNSGFPPGGISLQHGGASSLSSGPPQVGFPPGGPSSQLSGAPSLNSRPKQGGFPHGGANMQHSGALNANSGPPSSQGGFPPGGLNLQHGVQGGASNTSSGPPQGGFPPGGSSLQHGGQGGASNTNSGPLQGGYLPGGPNLQHGGQVGNHNTISGPPQNVFPPGGPNLQHGGQGGPSNTNSGPPQGGFPPGGSNLQQGGQGGPSNTNSGPPQGGFPPGGLNLQQGGQNGPFNTNSGPPQGGFPSGGLNLQQGGQGGPPNTSSGLPQSGLPPGGLNPQQGGPGTAPIVNSGPPLAGFPPSGPNIQQAAPTQLQTENSAPPPGTFPSSGPAMPPSGARANLGPSPSNFPPMPQKTNFVGPGAPPQAFNQRPPPPNGPQSFPGAPPSLSNPPQPFAGAPNPQQSFPGGPPLYSNPPQSFAGGPPPLSNPPQPFQGGAPYGKPAQGPYGPPRPTGQPPLQPPGANQLPNQMQGMNLGGQPYSGQMNGGGVGGGPHMPPPITQQQYQNGQQQPMRAAGFPPMQQAQQPGGYPQPGYQAAQQPKRLDPDQMPSPIQVTQDDQTNRSGVFATNQRGLVPPLVTTNYITQDQGNCSPRFMRSTMYNVPISNDIMKQTSVPFALAISPMARTVDQEYAPPIVNFGELGPVRCVRCKAYMCPFMQFIDSGRRFQCLFCKATTDVPQEYFQHLDHTGQRLDRYERPELLLGAYEFIATTDYCRNNVLPKPPAVIFVIDVSYNNIKSGLVHLLCGQMKEIIQNLPIDQGYERSNMRVGFITYNSCVHFYNVKGNLAAPQMLIVGDNHEMFMPLLDGFLCTPDESAAVIDLLMEQIPQMFGDTRETETILLPAIVAGLEALKASECTGKLMVFHSTLPTAPVPGQLKNRDDRKLLGTEKEKTILTPQNQAYNQLGQDCVQAGCSVDLFLFNNAYIDVATIGQVARLTGGEVFKYTYFQADIDGERLIQDIITDISRPIAFDGIMRVRTSTGVRPTDFYGHFFMSNTTDMELASIDCDKAVAIEIKHDDKLSEEEGVYIQAALLYTSCSGQRRLRILNLSLKTCSQMADLYRSCDCDTIINYIAKQSTFKLLEHNPKAVKDNIVTRGAQMLATYRKNCASPSSAGQLILPECMKLLPLYVNCLLKSDALSGGADMTIDDRSFVMQAVMVMDIPTSVNYFYPRLIPLIDLDVGGEQVEVPAPIRCTVEKMNEQGVYILENGIHMFLWIGLGASPDFVSKVFGVPTAIQVDIERIALPELDNPLSVGVRNVIEQVRMQRHRYMRLTIVRQREKLEPVFKHFLAEDRGTDGTASYVDFLIHMHKEIRSLLS